MKLCIWITKYFEQGGTKRVVTLLANELAKKHDVTLMVYDNRFKEDRDMYHLNEDVHIDFVDINDFVSHRRTPAWFYRGLIRRINRKTGRYNNAEHVDLLSEAIFPKAARERFVEYFNAQGYDYIIATARLSLFLAMLAPDLKAKTIGWQHSCYANYVEGEWSLFWKQEALLQHYIPKLDRYIVLTEYDVAEFKDKLGLEVYAIGNPKSFICEQKSDLSAKQFFVATRLVPRKGLKYLVRAFAEFCKQDQEWTLLIAGDGPKRKDLIKSVWKAKLQERVHFTGATNQVQKYFQQSSVYLMTSQFEGWGLVVIEAFEAGLPVIAFDIPPMDLLITDMEDGILVPHFNTSEYARAMLLLAHDKELRDSMGQKAIQKAKLYSIEEIAKIWDNMFLSLPDKKHEKND